MSTGRPSSQPNRFHYPQYANLQPPQPPAGYAHPSQYQQNQQQFPPHPSIRVPSNVKLSARQVPLGVGVSPPPVRYEGAQRAQQRPGGTGVLVQDFRFPTVPPIPENSPAKSKQELSQSPGRRDNMHESYMSSVLDDFTTPGTTPGSRSRGFPTPKRYSGSVYAESEALGVDERFDQGITSQESSRSNSPENSPQVVRQASLGKRAKPAMTTIKNRNSQLGHDNPEDGPGAISTNRAATMNAFSAAVAAGVTNKATHYQPEVPGSRSYTPVRMPFDTSPPVSPSADREYLQTPKSPSTIATTKLFEQTPGSSHSRKSTNPLLGLGIEQPSMSDKIPPSRRPPRLDMDAVRDAEQRGSTTSLADLIKRATRLAANLDRGKTASRLGMLDMWGSNDKLSGNNRHSTMSDMISAFPAPAVGGTPTNRGDAAWPLGEKGDAYASTSDLSKNQPAKKRKCCGLSLPIFFTVLVVIIILIAAAVLIPIFLILVPKQHSKENTCASSHPCRNGGTSIVSQNTCVCVCSNGFTGSQCETPGNAQDCMTSTVSDGAKAYKNATMGSSVVPALSDAQGQFNIPLNASTILSLFSANNLSCTSENSLIDFNSTSESTKTRRFVIIPGLEPLNNRFASVDESPAAPVVSKRTEPVGKLWLERRQDGVTVGTSNGIVFQATSATSIGAVSTPSASIGTDVSTITSVSGTATATGAAATSDSGSSAPSSTGSGDTTRPSSTVTDRDVGFARVLVLYVMQQSRTVDVAVKAQEQLESFFQQQTQGNSSTTVEVGEGNQRFTADFDALSITMGNGQVIGGKS